MSSSKQQIEKEIKVIQEQLWDALNYLASDFCAKCLEMQDTIEKYKKELEELQKQID